jgi:hypothetical protein
MDVYAQRVDAFGNAMWSSNGVPINIATGDQTAPLVASDGAAAPSSLWTDTRAGNADIYAQRINASERCSGRCWVAAICTVGNFQVPTASHPTARAAPCGMAGFSKRRQL